MIQSDLEKEFQQNWFTLKFNNSVIERDFILENQEDVLLFGKVVMAEVVVFTFVDCMFEVVDSTDGVQPLPLLIPIVLMAVGVCL